MNRAKAEPDHLEALFAAAVELPASEVAAFLEQACDEDDLRRELTALLAADRRAKGFIEETIAACVADLETARDEAPEPPRVGPYRLLRELGRGGMGTVHLAERDDREYHRQVAVKLLGHGLDSAALRHRFQAERQMLASLDHPNIARLFDGGTTADGRPYLVMELVDGQPIDAFCDARQSSIDDRLRLFEAVCAAVQGAHQKLIVHRDLKPSNVLVTADGVPKLLDFGIAKLLEPGEDQHREEPTARSQRFLTPSFASPEQIRGLPITTASDVYSLGVLLYLLLTGRHPYQLEGCTPRQVEQRVCELVPEKPSMRVLRDDPPGSHVLATRRASTPSRLSRRLRGDLDTIVLEALRKEPERRYRSVEALFDDLRRHRRGQPVLARADTLGYRAGKFVRRHAWGVTMATVLFILVVAFAVSSAMQAARTTRERDRAAQVSELLVHLFEIADPSTTRGNTITARELLDSGAGQLLDLPDRLENAPLLTTLARLYEELGLYERASPLYERALTIRRRMLEGDHPEIADSLHALARTLALRGAYERAAGLFREALELRRASLGEEHPDVTASLNNLGLTLHDLGRYREAEKIYLEVLARDRRQLGPGHLLTSQSLSNLALLRLDMGELEAAEALFREALAIRREALSEDDPDVAVTLEDVASTLHAQGELAAAEPLLRQALASQEAALGSEHLNVARTLTSLGRLLVDRGDLDAARPLLERALRLREKLLGESHPMVATCLEALAELAGREGDPAVAETLYRRALAIYEASFDGDHPQIAQVLAGLGAILVDDGDCATAEPLLSRALSSRRATHAPDSWLIAEVESLLGLCLLERGEDPAGHLLLDRSIAVLDARLGEQHPRSRRARVRREAALARRHDS